MISIKLANKLKEAGLKWEPKTRDYYYPHPYWPPNPYPRCLAPRKRRAWKNRYCGAPKEAIWCLRLDQLLAEIERRGWVWDLKFDIGGCHKYSCAISNDTDYEFIAADTPDDAAGKALLWILEQEAQTND